MRRVALLVCSWVAFAAIAAGMPSAEAGTAKAPRKAAPRASATNREQAPRKSDGVNLATERRSSPVPSAPGNVKRVLQTMEPTRIKVRVEHARKHAKRSMAKRALTWADHLFDTLHLHPQPYSRNGLRKWRATEERPFFEIVSGALGVDVGLTISEISRVAGQGGREFVHVVGADGSQNFELVLGRKEIGFGQRIEFQGPAINTKYGMPLGFRAAGLGFTSDLFEPGQRRALSYTLEAKLTERAVAYWAPFWAPAAATAVDQALGTAGNHLVANLVAGALPFVSAGLAVQSGVRAWRVLRDRRAGKTEKVLAVGHAVADAVRVFFPVIGTLANVGLVAASTAITYFRVKQAKRELAAETDLY